MRIYESMGVGVCFDLCWRKKKERRKIDLSLEREEESRKNRRMSEKEESKNLSSTWILYPLQLCHHLDLELESQET